MKDHIKIRTELVSFDEEESERIFSRLAFQEFHCGDCLLHIALHNDRGLEFYLEHIKILE